MYVAIEMIFPSLPANKKEISVRIRLGHLRILQEPFTHRRPFVGNNPKLEPNVCAVIPFLPIWALHAIFGFATETLALLPKTGLRFESRFRRNRRSRAGARGGLDASR
jgi:hypothetical protein